MGVKQIRRNIAKNTNATLKQYSSQMKPGWQDMPQQDLNLFASLAKNGITVQDLDREIANARKQAYQDTVVAVQKMVYASFAIVLKDEFGFSNEDCYKALCKTDQSLLSMIDNDEPVKIMEERIGIRFNSENGVERIEFL